MNILETKNLTKQFGGVIALNDLSVRVEVGTVTALIGPNGSGKTTLINVVSGMIPFDEGTVRIAAGGDLHALRRQHMYRHGAARTFQDIRLFEQMTVLDNISVVLTRRNVFSALVEMDTVHHLQRAQEVLERVALWDKRNELAESLSYGQRKLLEIARALAVQPELYLFDEPFAGLFPEMVRIVSDVITSLRQEGKTVVLVEHNMDIIRALSDHAIVMDGGVVLAEGTPEDVLSSRKVIEAYVGT